MKAWRLCEILIRQLHTANTRQRKLLQIGLTVYAQTRVSWPIVSKSTREQTLCEHNRTPNALYPIIILATYHQCIRCIILQEVHQKLNTRTYTERTPEILVHGTLRWCYISAHCDLISQRPVIFEHGSREFEAISHAPLSRDTLFFHI